LYLSIYGDIIANVMLGADFRSGNSMIPWIMVSSFFYGLTLFPENRLKFASKYAVIIKGYIACSLLNIIFNFIAIPVLNYKWAAISTFISYLCLMLYFFRADLKLNSFVFNGYKPVVHVSILLAFQFIIHFLFRKSFSDYSLTTAISEACVLCVLYCLYIYAFQRKTLVEFIRYYK
jgi:O-antigen/teichoic acid export membrane protein